MSESKRASIPRYPGLDGLRAVAVLLVIFFHLDTKPWVSGGYIGVDLFFVISGFLITTLLLNEHARTGRIDFPSFYRRRVRRLLPALVATVLLVVVVSWLVLEPGARHYPTTEVLTRSVLASLLFGYNWLVALRIEYLHPLGHVWSLSVEEQFYALWPLAMLVFFRFRISRRRIQQLIGGVIFLSLSIPFWWWDWDWQRLYYGSDYRAHAILAGCLLAMLWSEPQWRARAATSPWLRPVALASVAWLAMISFCVPMDTAEMYLGGFALSVLACAIVVFWTVASKPDAWNLRWLEARPLVWMGRRSYGAYLYHMPLVIWSRRLDLPLLDQLVLVLGITLLLTEASYRYLERPVIAGRRQPLSLGVDREAQPTAAA